MEVIALTTECDTDHIQHSRFGIYKMYEEVTYERCRDQSTNRS